MKEKTIEDWLKETVIPLSEVPKRIPSRPSLATIWRWTRTGCKGHVLGTFVLGAKRHTSAEEVLRFLAAINAGSGRKSRVPSAVAGSADARAAEELTCYGL